MSKKWVAVALAALVLLIVGLRWYKAGAHRSEMQQTVVNRCAGNANCVRAVEEHYGPCFESLRDFADDAQLLEQIENCIDRRLAEQTMDDMRLIATAWEARASAYNTYSTEPGSYDPNDPGFGKAIQVRRGKVLSYDELASILTPDYATSLPKYDRWGNAYEFAVSTGGSVYLIRSLGKDGQADENDYVDGPTYGWEGDLVYSNERFIKYPEGTRADQLK
jgi:hypothetical protein